MTQKLTYLQVHISALCNGKGLWDSRPWRNARIRLGDITDPLGSRSVLDLLGEYRFGAMSTVRVYWRDYSTDKDGLLREITLCTVELHG